MKNLKAPCSGVCQVNGLNRLILSVKPQFIYLKVLTGISLIAITVLASCQKVISLDLNSASPQLVVEANITDRPGPYYVILSRTVNFENITSIPGVTGATVEISDSSGNSETLTDLGGGKYKTSFIQGTYGQSYKLTIKTDGQVYESYSTMPNVVTALKLSITREVEDRPSFGGSSDSQTPRYQMNYEVYDPEQYTNYYRFVAYHKNREITSRRVFDDQFSNGKIIAGEFGLRDSIDFKPGDTITVELQNIDKGAYDFFRTLRNGAAGLAFLSASPSNPISNISNNGLGYFSACSINSGYSIIPN